MGIHPYVAQEADYMSRLRRHFHSHPELSMQEYQTAERIEAELREIGIETRRVGGTGVLGILRGTAGGTGKKIVLRADTDALPIQDGELECRAVRDSLRGARIPVAAMDRYMEPSPRRGRSA